MSKNALKALITSAIQQPPQDDPPRSLGFSQVLNSASWAKRQGLCGVVFKNCMWILAGWTGTGITFTGNDVWYSANGISWTAANLKAPWSPGYGYQCVVFNKEMWLITGDPVASVWHSSNGVDWILATSNPPFQPRSEYACFVFNNKIWLLGGCKSNSFVGDIRVIGTFTEGTALDKEMNDVWCSSDGANWTLATDNAPWSGRSYANPAVYEGKIWILGGSNNPGRGTVTHFNDVWSSLDGVNWNQVLPNASWQPGYQGSSFIHRNSLCITAASVAGNGNDQIWATADGVNWSLLVDNPGWAGRMRMLCLPFRGKIWLLGGYDIGCQEGYNDVWCSD